MVQRNSAVPKNRPQAAYQSSNNIHPLSLINIPDVMTIHFPNQKGQFFHIVSKNPAYATSTNLMLNFPHFRVSYFGASYESWTLKRQSSAKSIKFEFMFTPVTVIYWLRPYLYTSQHAGDLNNSSSQNIA